jgi:hypothetical protein
MMNDNQFLHELDEIRRASTNLKNEFRKYNYKDYIENERDMKQLKAKVLTLYQMMENMVENRVATLSLASNAIEHRRRLITQMNSNPHVKEHWEIIMSTLAILN